MTDSKRTEQQAVANKLQEILGNKYIVYFDDCESCLTRVFYKASNGEMILVKEVPNEYMKTDISITDFTLPRAKMYELFTRGIL